MLETAASLASFAFRPLFWMPEVIGTNDKGETGPISVMVTQSMGVHPDTRLGFCTQTYGPILGINQDFRRWTGYEECFQVLSLARRVAQEPDGIRIDTYEPAPDHVGVLKVQIIEQIVYVQNCEPVVQVLWAPGPEPLLNLNALSPSEEFHTISRIFTAGQKIVGVRVQATQGRPPRSRDADMRDAVRAARALKSPDGWPPKLQQQIADYLEDEGRKRNPMYVLPLNTLRSAWKRHTPRITIGEVKRLAQE